MSRRLQHHRASAIAKQHASGAVLEINNAGKHLSTHDQRFVGSPRLDHRIGHAQGIDKAAAHRLNIKRRAAIGTQLVLQDAGRGREHHVRRGGGHDDQIDVSGIQTGGFQALREASSARSLL